MNNARCPWCGASPKRHGVEHVFCGTIDCPMRNEWMLTTQWNRRFVCNDKNGKAVYAGSRIKLSCGCCTYTVKLIGGVDVPSNDGKSQVHGKDIDVWEHEFELIEVKDD